MRTVFPSAQVAHLWANRSQPSARNGNRTVYFNGDTIYSYGGHFPMATWAHKPGYGDVVLLNTNSYSISTSRHQRYVRQALADDVKIVPVKDPLGTGERNLAGAVKDAEAAFKKLKLGRGEWLIRDYKRQTEIVAKVADWYVLPMPTLPVVTAEMRAKIMERQAADVGRAERKRRSEALRERSVMLGVAKAAGFVPPENFNVENDVAWEAVRDQIYFFNKAWHKRSIEEKRADWQAGLSVALPWEAQKPVMLRAIKSRVETSQGATFPLADGIKAVAFIRSVKANGKSWHRNGETLPVGGFQVDHIDSEGNVKAGCHDIANSEIERLAKEIGI